MKTWLITLATTVALVGPASARTYTYMCQVNDKSYPVTLTTPYEKDSSSVDATRRGSLSGGTITWRGVTFRNVKWEDDCHAKFTATRDGVTIELCTATQGVADLTVGKDTFECQMPEQRRTVTTPRQRRSR
jgi:hypothetical protein